MSPNPAVDDVSRDVEAALDVLQPELPQAWSGVARERVALRELHAELRERGEATARTLKRIAKANDWHRGYATPTDFWRTVVDPYLRLLPGVIGPNRRGDTWACRPELEDGQPDPPADPVPPAEDDVDAVIQDVIARYPGRNGARAAVPVRRAFEHLQDVGTATAADLREASGYDTVGGDGTPEQGRFTSRGAWFREVARPALRDLPGVVAPSVAGDPWVYVGADHPEA